MDGSLNVSGEGFFQTLVSQSSFAFQVLSRTGRISYGNPAAQILLGYDSAGLSGIKFLSLVHPDDRRIAWSATAGNKNPDGFTEIRLLHTSGHWIWVRGTASLSGESTDSGSIFLNYQDITDLKNSSAILAEQHEQLQIRAAELAESNTELERFAFMSSHDLQEPLRMVTGFLTLLKKKYSDKLDADAQQYIGFAVEGAERMRSLIAHLLEYSRLGKNKDDLNLVDLNIVCLEATALFREQIEISGAEIEAGHLPVVKGKKTQLQQVFQNLISNALKYRSADPPKIKISCSEVNSQWRFEFRDNGIGIDPQFHERIFQIFQRLHSKSQYSGTGIGLAICKKIIEQHGGRIWVESAPEKGSAFIFTMTKA